MAQQVTIADWLKAQATAGFKAVEDSLYAEADAQGGGVDYRELEHEEDQLRYSLEAAAEWDTIPPTQRVPYN